MTDDRVFAFDNEDNATQLLQGLISPVPAQALVTPPPDTPPRSGPGETTPLTGSLAAPPSQATAKVDPVPLPDPRSAKDTLASIGSGPKYDSALSTQVQQARGADDIPINPYADQYKVGLGTKIRRGLAGYFSGGIGGALNTDSSVPTSTRQQLLSEDEANVGNLNKSYDTSVKAYKQTLDRAKNAALSQRSQQQQNADLGRRVEITPENESGYVKVLSKGTIGYLPKANLAKAQQRDKNLKVLE